MLDFKRKKLLENKRNPLIYPAFFNSPEPHERCEIQDVTLVGGLTLGDPNGNNDLISINFIDGTCDGTCWNVRIYSIEVVLLREQLNVTSQSIFNPVNIAWLGGAVIEVGEQYRVVITNCADTFTYFDNTITAIL